MVSIQIETTGEQEIIRRFNAIPAQIKRARKRAIKKTLNTMLVKGRRKMAAVHNIPLSALRKSGSHKARLVARVSRRATSGSLWFGNNPIKSGAIGRLKAAPNHGGAFAREFFFDQGFLATLKSGRQGIFSRTSRSRLPIKEQAVDLHSAEAVVRDIRDETRGLFQTILQRELNYEVNVRGGN